MVRQVLASGLAIAVLAVTVGCSGTQRSADDIEMPGSSRDYAGEQHQEVVDELRAAGFTNVETEALGDLVTGWLNPEGSVDQVEVDGSRDFDAGETYARDVAIVIAYHSFPVSADATSEPAPASEEGTAAPVEPSSPAIEESTLTVDNSEDLAALLAASDMDTERFVQFTAAYEGRTVVFDGHIASMANHGDYDTRYDILIYAGIAEDSALTGPSFLFEDVNTVHDLHLAGDDIPETIGVGDNLRITARVDGYVPESGLFLLEPVSTEVL